MMRINVLIEPIMRLREKKFKETFNWFMEDIQAKSSFKTSTRDGQALINVIYVKE